MTTNALYQKLFASCAIDDLEGFNSIIQQPGIDLEYRNEHGWTMMIVAAFNHSYKIVERLIESGADVNATNHKGTTVFMYAKTKVLENRNLAFLDYLIAHGADVGKTDMLGKNVLQYVESTNALFLIEYLNSKLHERK